MGVSQLYATRGQNIAKNRAQSSLINVTPTPSIGNMFPLNTGSDDDEPWRPDTPVEQSDGTLGCKRHGLEICGKCCVDYTFMREVSAQDTADPEDSSSSESNMEKKSADRCAVCSVQASKRCSKCHKVYCASGSCLYKYADLTSFQDCTVEHQRQ
ncbi:11963_t:CDS:1, partial [Acaulospora colombiana]